MSLFKARDWWSVTLGDGEEFDQGCLCVGDVDNSGAGHGQFDVWFCVASCETEADLLMVHLLISAGQNIAAMSFNDSCHQSPKLWTLKEVNVVLYLKNVGLGIYMWAILKEKNDNSHCMLGYVNFQKIQSILAGR